MKKKSRRGEEHTLLGRELSLPKRCSEEMVWLMDHEFQRLFIIRNQWRVKYRPEKDMPPTALAEALMEEEMLERADVERIIQSSKE